MLEPVRPKPEALNLSGPIALDLFCGVGGMSLGFEQAGFCVAAAFDAEPRNVRTYRNNFPGVRVAESRLEMESGASLRRAAGVGDTDLHLVFGGPPCQGFSIGGRREVDDERNRLVFTFATLVRQLQPRYFVMENVRGLMAKHARPIMRSFLTRVRRAGYDVVEPIKVLNAADYGVPQKRLRVFVLGYRKGQKSPRYPAATTAQGTGPRVWDALADLPRIEDESKYFDDDTYGGRLQPTSPYAQVLHGVVPDPADRSGRSAASPTSLTGCFRTRHSPAVTARFAATPPGAAEPISRYIRLEKNGVSTTIRAGTGSDRGNHTAPRPIHPSAPRCITAREAARLHSFPDWFRFHGSRWGDFRQIGNSVPPLLARAVADSLRRSAFGT